MQTWPKLYKYPGCVVKYWPRPCHIGVGTTFPEMWQLKCGWTHLWSRDEYCLLSPTLVSHWLGATDVFMPTLHSIPTDRHRHPRQSMKSLKIGSFLRFACWGGQVIATLNPWTLRQIEQLFTYEASSFSLCQQVSGFGLHFRFNTERSHIWWDDKELFSYFLVCSNCLQGQCLNVHQSPGTQTPNKLWATSMSAFEPNNVDSCESVEGTLTGLWERRSLNILHWSPSWWHSDFGLRMRHDYNISLDPSLCHDVERSQGGPLMTQPILSPVLHCGHHIYSLVTISRSCSHATSHCTF